LKNKESMRRRAFIGLTAAASAGTLISASTRSINPLPDTKLKILILGGTNFLGPAVVESALCRNHDVTLFNRGITRPHLFPGIEKLRGDRRIEGGDLVAIEGLFFKDVTFPRDGWGLSRERELEILKAWYER
jgi:2'-hydroxyisoflavone reductase